MKITKYPQSCLKLEHNNRALLFDLGTLATAAYSLNDLGDFDAVLFTHRHPDHFDVRILPELLGRGITCYGNADVGQAAGNLAIEVIEDGEELVIADFKIKTCHLEHCLMVGGSSGVPNTGYLINDSVLIPGDSVVDPGFTCNVL
ncbi:MAG TPA: MBL fold metallo-hydrolase, partial [Candidatus Polarisedimenticolaceae bacterium]|nr:MBL fold metallo-hydrolase [Candidatus Polarisedimenticolaceae bacterium]